MTTYQNDTSSAAAPETPGPETARVPAMLTTLAAQRNEGLDAVAHLQGELAVTQRHIADLQAQVEDLTGQLERAKAPAATE